MSQVKTLEHDWVKHVVCPVETLPDADGDPYIFVDPDAQNRAEQEAVYGCRACNEPMVQAFGTECKGHDNEG